MERLSVSMLSPQVRLPRRRKPLDHKVYTVKSGVATGELYLYRGTYDLYLVSYNSSTEVPELKTDGTIQVSNGKDFMYTSLKGIVVQPNQTGENMMDIVLAGSL